ncbi:MAG TPA: hypothetical protein VGL97_20460 [Bryobacteraceae bacterium]|jgi:Cu/Ag efflux protein CusF
MLKLLSACLMVALPALLSAAAQEPASAQKQPLEHVLGTVIAVDSAAHTVTVKEDKTGTDHTILLANTRTLLKVAPGAKDLKSASRITAEDLQVGDRVDVRGIKPEDNPAALAAKSVVLMSARDLQAAHQAQAAAWQNSTSAVVTSIDPASGKLNATAKTPEGPKPLVIETGKETEFSRYSPANPKTPAASELSDIQPGDQLRVIGNKSADGGAITAEKVYSAAFRTISATINSIAPDGKSVTVKDLATKKMVAVSLDDDSAVRKLPPMMAMMLARRFNPNYKPTTAAPQSSAGPPAGGTPAGHSGEGRPGGMHSARSGDVSQMLERVPKISLSDLKQGDAVVISGVATGTAGSALLATNVIAGVEPILQSAPQRQSGQNLSGDWGLGDIAPPQ